MKFHLRKPSPAMVVACISLFIGLSGVGTAAVVVLKKNSVLSKHIKNGQVQSADVKDSSLLGRDFAPGQLAVGAQGPQGERGLQGERGAQGPGAVGINYSVPGSSSGLFDDIATVGPWKIAARCSDFLGETIFSVWAQGPGFAQFAGVTSAGDVTRTPVTGGLGLDPDRREALFQISASSPEFFRIALDIQLHSASDVATLSVNGIADRRSGSPGSCLLVGTAVPVS